jgi:hypothetical protein
MEFVTSARVLCSILMVSVCALVPCGAGAQASCSVGGDGTVACSESDAALGAVPVALGAVSQLAVAGGHACAIRASDSMVLCWGRDAKGESEVPASLGPAASITVKRGESCASALADGATVCWGRTPSDAQETALIGGSGYDLVGFLKPASDVAPVEGDATMVTLQVTRHRGRPIPDDEARTLAAGCQLTLVITGASTRAQVCMQYDARHRVFTWLWKPQHAGAAALQASLARPYGLAPVVRTQTVTVVPGDDTPPITVGEVAPVVGARLVAFFGPVQHASATAGSRINVSVEVVDASGLPVTTAVAQALAAACQVTFSAWGAQSHDLVCMHYNARRHRFNWQWRTSHVTGSVLLRVAATVPGTADWLLRRQRISLT